MNNPCSGQKVWVISLLFLLVIPIGLDKPPAVLVCVLPAPALLSLLAAPLLVLAAPLRLLLGPLPAPLSGPSARGIILRSAVLLTTIVPAPSLVGVVVIGLLFGLALTSIKVAV